MPKISPRCSKYPPKIKFFSPERASLAPVAVAAHEALPAHAVAAVLPAADLSRALKQKHNFGQKSLKNFKNLLNNFCRELECLQFLFSNISGNLWRNVPKILTFVHTVFPQASLSHPYAQDFGSDTWKMKYLPLAFVLILLF